MANFHLKFEKRVSAHSRSEISTIIQNPFVQSQFISIGYDSLVTTWSSKDMTKLKSFLIADPYLTSITPFQGKFLIGVGSGKILQLNQELSQIEKEYLVHEDCITSISIAQKNIITTSVDGFIHFLNKSTFQKEQSINIESPIFRSLIYKNYLYVCSNPSFQVNLETLAKKQIGHYNQFIVHKDLIYGCSDQVGITCLKTKYKTYVPSQFIISIDDGIVFLGESVIGYFVYDKDVQMSWKMELSKQLKPGFIVLSGLIMGQNVFLVEESGDLYKFSIQKDKGLKSQN